MPFSLSVGCRLGPKRLCLPFPSLSLFISIFLVSLSVFKQICCFEVIYLPISSAKPTDTHFRDRNQTQILVPPFKTQNQMNLEGKNGMQGCIWCKLETGHVLRFYTMRSINLDGPCFLSLPFFTQFESFSFFFLAVFSQKNLPISFNYQSLVGWLKLARWWWWWWLWLSGFSCFKKVVFFRSKTWNWKVLPLSCFFQLWTQNERMKLLWFS